MNDARVVLTHDPPEFEKPSRQGRPERARELIASLAPVQAAVRQVTPELTQRRELDAEALEPGSPLVVSANLSRLSARLPL